MAHSWEERRAYAWDDTTDESESESGDAALTPEEAGRELADMLISMRLNGRLSAREACVLAHWAYRAGAVGEVKVLAFKPGGASGNYQRHFDMAVGYGAGKGRFTAIAIPGHAPHDLSAQSTMSAFGPCARRLQKSSRRTELCSQTCGRLC